MVSETSLDDLKYGQIVIVNARWLLVVAGFIFLLYRPNNTSELIAGILGVLAIAVINFYLYTRILKKEAVPANWVYLASAIDLGVISLLNYVQGGLGSKAFPFYYAAILCFSLVFETHITSVLAGGVLLLYALICLNSNPPMQFKGDEQILVVRLLTLAGVAFVANRYRHIERDRRQKEVGARLALQSELVRRTKKA
jgi:hypothetical protein